MMMNGGGDDDAGDGGGGDGGDDGEDHINSCDENEDNSPGIFASPSRTLLSSFALAFDLIL